MDWNFRWNIHIIIENTITPLEIFKFYRTNNYRLNKIVPLELRGVQIMQ